MLHTRTIVALVLGSACIIFAIGLPWLFNKHRTPAEHAVTDVATTEDIQQFDLMWTDLESLQNQSARLGPEQYKQQFLESTIAFLRLDSPQTKEFLAVADECLKRLIEARDKLRNSRKQAAQKTGEGESSHTHDWSEELPATTVARREAWSQWSNDQREASDLLLGALQKNARHNLLAERRLLWLLKLDFSLRDANE